MGQTQSSSSTTTATITSSSSLGFHHKFITQEEYTRRLNIVVPKLDYTKSPFYPERGCVIDVVDTLPDDAEYYLVESCNKHALNEDYVVKQEYDEVYGGYRTHDGFILKDLGEGCAPDQRWVIVSVNPKRDVPLS